MPRITVVFDNALKEKEPWVEKLCATAKLTLVDNDKVAHHMSHNDQEAKAALRKEAADPVSAAERLAPHYKRALEFIYGKEERLALYGTAWLVYTQPIDACIVDWSEIDRKANTPTQIELDAKKQVEAALKGKGGTPVNQMEETRKQFEKTARAFVKGRLTKYVPPGKLLELPLKLSDYEKSIQASAFLRKLNLVA